MTRNQKIALGCGGAGCLGLIVVVIAVCAIYFISYRTKPRYRAGRDYVFNINASNANENSNSNTNSNQNSNSNSDSSASSSLSDDDKHKLFYAATMTGDTELVNRVCVKIGIMNDDFTPGDEYQKFVAAHVAWSFQNTDFIRTVNTAEKARAYVNEHFPE